MILLFVAYLVIIIDLHRLINLCLLCAIFFSQGIEKARPEIRLLLPYEDAQQQSSELSAPVELSADSRVDDVRAEPVVEYLHHLGYTSFCSDDELDDMNQGKPLSSYS